MTYFAANHAEVPDNPDEVNNYPQEFLHTLALSGMPPHTLELKVGCIVKLLRNLDPSNGLCNGTQLFVWHLYRNNVKNIKCTPALPTLLHPASCAFSTFYDHQQSAGKNFPEGGVRSPKTSLCTWSALCCIVQGYY